MSRVALLLALLLVCSLPAMTLAAATPETVGTTSAVTPVEANETTNRLSLTGDVRSESVVAGPDFGATAATADDALRIDQELYDLETKFDDADNTERQELIEVANDRLVDRIDAIEERERETVRQHADGNLSDEELLQMVVRNYNEASVLAEKLDGLSDRSNAVAGYSFDDRSDQSRLDIHQSNVNALIDMETRGQAGESTTVVAVETSENGYSLSVIDGESYVHETTRFDNRDTTQPNQFDSPSEAYDRARELYPWATDNADSPTVSARDSASLYWIQIPHDQGSLGLYLDAGTEGVFKELQTLTLDSLPSESTDQTWTDEELTVALNETPANGPVEVNAIDSTTGEPAAATVSINGTEVGETDEGGTLWVIPPTGEYELTVESALGSVNVTMTENEGSTESSVRAAS